MSSKPVARFSVNLALIMVTSLFFLWGLANNLNDILIQQFKKAFVLSDFQSSLVQSAFYLGYFFLAIPAALVMQRFGFKLAMITGLLLYAIGALLFYPAAQVQEYRFFLFALFVIASGLAFLETSANPYIVRMGDPAGAQQRLNFAQSFNPLGSISGVLIGQHFIFSGVEHSEEQLALLDQVQQQAYFAAEAQAVQAPYLVIGCTLLVIALLFCGLKLPVNTVDNSFRYQGFRSSLSTLLRNPSFVAAAITQFCYVGAQVGVWSFTIRYALQADVSLSEKSAASLLTASLVLFICGRFIGTALMSKIEGRKLMALFAFLNVALCGIALTLPTQAGIYAVVLTGFGMSIMFPTIFALGIAHTAENTKVASSILIMTIIGGAIFPAIMGAVSDHSNIASAFGLPLLCFAVVAWFAVHGYRLKS